MKTKMNTTDNKQLEDIVNDTMNTIEAAAYLKIAVPTLQKLCRQNEVPFARVGTRRLLFRRSTLNAWIAKQERRNFR